MFGSHRNRVHSRAKSSLGQHTTNHQHKPPRSNTLLRHWCPSKPHGTPPSEPTPLLGRGALWAQQVLTAVTAPGYSGREVQAGSAAGCGSAVCRERRKGSGFGVQSNESICSPAGCIRQSWVLWLTQKGQWSTASHLARTPPPSSPQFQAGTTTGH